jgi:LuxR family maltose regulon positive regulatory protein
VEQLLTTKLFIPPARPDLVSRPRLIERLNEGSGRKLILISAPAGSGKTTILSEWIASCQRPAAWLSLDEEDKDPSRFLIYLIVALQTVAPNIGQEMLAALHSPQQPPTVSILSTLLNEIAALREDIILILDDYYAVDSKPVDKALTFLLEHLPPQLHIVIATREDPQLPLARYRAKGELSELRLADLRFSVAEADVFLNQMMGLNLSAQDTATLDTRTEGWIVGLQLAALSMQGLEDTNGFIQSFTGSHRYVLDYLLEEVLQKQPENIQSFLLCTSILDRLSGPLCDAVLLDVSASSEGADGQDTLEYLERANLFIVPLDNERRWYRYHHLFAELLRNRLTHMHPDQLPDLHHRASDWFEQNDFPPEAIEHALKGHDWQRASELIEHNFLLMRINGGIIILLTWLESFPAGLLLERTKLGLVYAWALTMASQLDRAEQHLDRILPFVQGMPTLLGEWFAVCTYIAAFRSDMPAVISLAQQAMSLLPAEESFPHGNTLLCLGVAYDEVGGDINAAKGAFQEAYDLRMKYALIEPKYRDSVPLTAFAHLVEIEWLEGKLRGATKIYQQMSDLAKQWGGQFSIGICRALWVRASLYYEWNDLEGAASTLMDCVRVAELWRNPRLVVRAYGLTALVMQARGQSEEANSALGRAEQITRDSYTPPTVLGSLAFYQIAVWIAQNNWPAISNWEISHGTEWQEQIGRARDELAIVHAHAYIARYYWNHEDVALSQARLLIEPALERAETGGLMFNVVRLLILYALTLSAQGETALAITTLKRAVVLAGPENYVRSFLDIGKPMEGFLSWCLESGSLSEPHLRMYVSKLLSCFRVGSPSKSGLPSGEGLIEPLTARELEVLRLIAQGLSNREISERLFLALSTVKGHTRIIFDKLQVQRRTEAVARARELDIL